jgi:hypothetical protein
MSEDDSRKRRSAGLAAVAVSGKLGYPNLSIPQILDVSGLEESDFHEIFSHVAESYAAGYALGMDELAGVIREACESAEGLPQKMIAGLTALSMKIASEPDLARGLLAEVHLAGGAVLRTRERFVQQFEELLNGLQGASDTPPPVTATFVLGMIEAVATRSLREEDPSVFAKAIPDLMFIAVTLYSGRDTAEAAYERFRRD